MTAAEDGAKLPIARKGDLMTRRTLVPALCAGAILALGAATATSAPDSFLNRNTIVTGFFKGDQVRYFDFGAVKLAAGNKTAPIWTVTNGVKAQRNIIDTVPGQRSYSPLWTVRAVTFRPGVEPRLLTSKRAVDAALGAGDVTVKNMRVVVNCPVI